MGSSLTDRCLGGMMRCKRFFEKNASELEYGLQDAKVATGELAFLRGICTVFKKPRQCPKLQFFFEVCKV